MTVKLQHVKEIFLTALDIAEPAEREAYLARACGGEAALRKLVVALLGRHARAGQFLEQPAVIAALTEACEPAPAAAGVDRLVQRLRGTAETPNRADTHELLPDTDTLGPYRLRRLLGAGGMGLVFEAEDPHLRRLVALKVMRPDTCQRPGTRERFLREARAVAAVRHDHIVTIYQVGQENDLPYLVMELLQGQSLETRCQRGPLPVSEIVRIGREVAEGLAAAHAQGVTHRDIKPDNIWLEAPRDRVKLLDFGLARALEGEAPITQSGLIVGTPAYMAPEQASGGAVEPRSDLFSLGCVLYRLASGRPPFQGESALAVLHALANDTPPPLQQLAPACPAALVRLVEALLQRRPTDRPASAQAVVETLTAIEQGEKVACRSATGRSVAKRKATLFWLLAVLVLLVVGTALLLRRHGETDLQPTPSVADRFRRADVPEEVLVRAGGGDKSKAPPELVGVLGDARCFRVEGTHLHNVYTRFSPDGRFLVTVSLKDVLVFAATTGKLIWRFAHDAFCGWFDFHPEGESLAVSTESGVDLWHLDTGQSLGRLTGGPPLTYGLSYTPDGKSLVTTDADGQARLWDVANKKPLRTFSPPAGHRFIQAPQVHPSLPLVALHASGPKPTVRLHDLTTGDQKGELPGTGGVASVDGLEYQTSVRFSPDGKVLAVVRDGREVQLWEVPSWKAAGVLDGGASILAFSADSATLFRGHVFNVWKAQVRLEALQPTGRKGDWWLPVVGDLSWSDLSPDGRTIALRTAMNKSIALFDSQTGVERFPPRGHRGDVTGVAMSPDGHTVASVGRDNRLLLWNLDQCVRGDREAAPPRELEFTPGSVQRLAGVGFGLEGKRVAIVTHETGYPGWVRLFDPASGATATTLQNKNEPRSLVAFALHPIQAIAATTDERQLQRWDLDDGSATSWEASTTTLALHPDGRQLATGDRDGNVVVWEMEKYRRVRNLRCDGPVLRVGFSPDGQTLAATTAAPDAALYLWDLSAGKRQRRTGHANSVGGLSWSPNSRELATATDDGTVRVWRRETSRPARAIHLHAGKQGQLAFTSEGRHVLTANADGSIYLLRLNPLPE